MQRQNRDNKNNSYSTNWRPLVQPHGKILDIQNIAGALTAGTTTTLTVGLVQPDVVSPADVDNGIIGGVITLGGTSFTMASDIEASLDVIVSKGAFDFVSYTLNF